MEKKIQKNRNENGLPYLESESRYNPSKGLLLILIVLVCWFQPSYCQKYCDGNRKIMDNQIYFDLNSVVLCLNCLVHTDTYRNVMYFRGVLRNKSSNYVYLSPNPFLNYSDIFIFGKHTSLQINDSILDFSDFSLDFIIPPGPYSDSAIDSVKKIVMLGNTLEMKQKYKMTTDQAALMNYIDKSKYIFVPGDTIKFGFAIRLSKISAFDNFRTMRDFINYYCSNVYGKTYLILGDAKIKVHFKKDLLLGLNSEHVDNLTYDALNYELVNPVNDSLIEQVIERFRVQE